MTKGFLSKIQPDVWDIADYICAVLLALCYLLQHYVSLLYNAAITSMVLMSIYLIIRMIMDVSSIKLSNFCFVMVMLIYQAFRIVNHGTTLTEFGQSGVFMIFMLALALGKINVGFFVSACRVICLVASCLLILQYIFFYVFGVHLQLVITSLLIPAADQWILGAQTGLAGITGRIGNFYRPSAFFLEPAHVYLYMFPHIILILFDSKIDRKALLMAALISCGVVLSTSGMGIAAVMGIWSLFLLLRNEEDGSFSLKNVLRKRNLLLLLALLVVFALSVMFVPFIGRAVRRIFVPGNTGSTAITGRVRAALELISTLTPLQWFFGVADNTHGITFHIPGVLDILYRHGIIGLILSYEFYVKCLWKLRFSYKFVAAVILVTSFFSAHTHSTVGMLYYVLILFNGLQKLESIRSYDVLVPQSKANCFINKYFGWIF